MWREKFRIGVDTIDEQHKELFDITGKLLQEIQSNRIGHRQECISMLIFLKQYALKHFADEEDYQIAVGYPDYAEHKKQHSEFIEALFFHERKMDQSDYAEKDIREFIGFVLTYMLYHVAVMDQGIVKNTDQTDDLNNLRYKVWHGFSKVFCRMTGFDNCSVRSMKRNEEDLKDAVIVKVDFSGHILGCLTYIYTASFIKNLVGSLMNIETDTVGELEISVLRELSNIISVTICNNLFKGKNHSWSVGVPRIVSMVEASYDEKIILKTIIGIVEIDIDMLDKYRSGSVTGNSDR